MDDELLQVFKDAHGATSALLAGQEPSGDQLLALDLVIRAAREQPLPYPEAVSTLLEASRAGDPKARAVLKAFGQEAFYEQHPEKRPLFKLRQTPSPGLVGNFFR